MNEIVLTRERQVAADRATRRLQPGRRSDQTTHHANRAVAFQRKGHDRTTGDETLDVTLEESDDHVETREARYEEIFSNRIRTRSFDSLFGRISIGIVPAMEYPRLRGAAALVTAPAFAAPKVA